MSRQIKLTKGKTTTVDDADYDFLTQWKWHAINGKYAARRQWYRENGVKKSHYILMHRVVAKTPSHLDTDHINGDTLDNQQSKLRNCTESQNMANTKLNIHNTTGYKGVILEKKSGKYVAQIGWQRKGIRKNFIIGRFKTAREAGVAYELEAKKRYGEFARLKLLGG